MADLSQPEVLALLDAPNCAVLSTQNGDGTILSTVVWVSLEDRVLAVNSAVGRRWPANLERDPHLTLVVYDPADPYRFVELRGTATPTFDDAEAHIDRLAQKYTGQDRYQHRTPSERRVKFLIEPQRIRFRAS